VGYAVVEEFPIDARTDYWLEKSLPAASVS